MTERFGCDFLIYSPVLGRIGVQRKEVKDFLASLYDDRLTREIPQLLTLEVGVIMIEGRMEWTNEGKLITQEFRRGHTNTASPLTRKQFRGILFSLQSLGLWTVFTDSKMDSMSLLSDIDEWAKKERHTSLLTRPSPRGEFGKADSRDWQIHVMQGWPGVGYGKAAAIVDHFHGLPLALTGDLTEVKGIGKKLAETIERSLAGAASTTPTHPTRGRTSTQAPLRDTRARRTGGAQAHGDDGPTGTEPGVIL